MFLVEKTLGNLHDTTLPEDMRQAVRQARVDVLELSQWDAQKHRLRGLTRKGRNLAIALARDTCLRDGDILLWDAPNRELVVCAVCLPEVLVLDISALRAQPPEESIAHALALGHALGNQHWPMLLCAESVLTPVNVDRAVMESAMRTHAIPGVSLRFVPGELVAARLTPQEARQLFGNGGPDPLHPHHAREHGRHRHEDNHEHSR